MPIPKIGCFRVSAPDCLGVPNRLDGKTDPVGVAAVGAVLGVPKAEEKTVPDTVGGIATVASVWPLVFGGSVEAATASFEGEKLNGALVVAVEVDVDGANEKVNGFVAELVAAVMTGAELVGVTAAVDDSEEVNEEKLKVAGEAVAVAGGNPNKGLLEGVAVPKLIPLPKSGAVPVGVDAACVETAGTPNFIPVDEPLADGAFPKVNPDGDGVAADDAGAETVGMPNLIGTEGVETGGGGATVPGLRDSQATHLVASAALLM